MIAEVPWKDLIDALTHINILLAVAGILMVTLGIVSPIHTSRGTIIISLWQRLALGVLGTLLLFVATLTMIPTHPLGSTPIGSIVAYPGRVVSDADLPSGWMLCDGRQIPDEKKFDELRRILSQTAWGADRTISYLPDLRGVFLRGVDDPDGEEGTPGANRDPDAATRHAARSRTQVGGIVGSFQEGATSLPKTPFKTDEAGKHSHNIHHSNANGTSGGTPFGESDGRGTAMEDHRTDEDGLHSHVVTQGGDRETRPINAYVNYIVKAWQP